MIYWFNDLNDFMISNEMITMKSMFYWLKLISKFTFSIMNLLSKKIDAGVRNLGDVTCQNTESGMLGTTAFMKLTKNDYSEQLSRKFKN